MRATNLTGPLPDGFARLTELAVLDLADNGITGRCARWHTSTHTYIYLHTSTHIYTAQRWDLALLLSSNTANQPDTVC